MAYRLGIDLGTASIGIARIALGERGEPQSIEGDVLIFSDHWSRRSRAAWVHPKKRLGARNDPPGG